MKLPFYAYDYSNVPENADLNTQYKLVNSSVLFGICIPKIEASDNDDQHTE